MEDTCAWILPSQLHSETTSFVFLLFIRSFLFKIIVSMVRLVIGRFKEVFKVLGNSKHLLCRRSGLLFLWQYSLLLESIQKPFMKGTLLFFFTGLIIILCTSFVLKAFQWLMSNLSPKAAKLFYFFLVVWSARVSQQALFFQIGWGS